jgi:hypothetical protein
MNEMNNSRRCNWDWKRFNPLAIVGIALGGLTLAVVIAFAFGWIVMYLWNYLMPAIFGLPAINFWQAWGLVVLSHILIKPGYGPHGGPGSGKRRHGPKPCGNEGGWHAEVKARFDGDERSAPRNGQDGDSGAE